MKKLLSFTMLACMTFGSAISATAFADDKSPTISDKKPPPSKDAPAKDAKEPAKAPVQPFDLSTLPPIDAATEKAIAKLGEACMASMMRREGIDPVAEAKCNVGMMKVTQRGKIGASAILAALNGPSQGNFFTRAKLWTALSRIDDEEVRSVVVDGLDRIASQKLTSHQSDMYQTEEALEAMFGRPIAATIPWDGGAVGDNWAELAKHVEGWKAVRDGMKGKKRSTAVFADLSKARKEKADADPKVAYRAVALIAHISPKEGASAARTYAARKELAADVKAAFDALAQSSAAEAEWRGSNRSRN